MIFKPLACLIISFILIHPAFGQDSTATDPMAEEEVKIEKPARAKVNHEIGINSTLFLRQFINFGASTNIAVSPIAFSYRLIDEKIAFHIAVGGTMNNSKSEDDDEPNVNITKSSTVDLSMGLGFGKEIHNNWNAYFALDFVYGIANSSSKTVDGFFNETITETASTTTGAGPILGIQYYFNKSKKLSFGTGLGFYYTHTVSVVTSEFSGFPQFDDEDTVTTDQFMFTVPTSLFFILRL